ncbi:hypothetical protein GGI15_002238 [Coemansia interrupta]|uniref:Uncharacterized protein n=1 Tax=Coemansia interrupta TaxID=1126814 RepID=A0A9W8LM37_9FUNG|nr:hypothetical protein GGI15_002238 [Coemansia interrupta]
MGFLSDPPPLGREFSIHTVIFSTIGLSADIRAQSLGIFYLVWVLQTFIFVLGSSRSNWGTFTLLVFLLFTNILTCVGHWAQRDDVLHASGYIGMLTAIIAWYNVAVDMLNKETFYFELPNPSIGMSILPEAIEPAVHTPFFSEACKPHHQHHHQQHHMHHHINAHKLEGHTPGNHFEFVATMPRTAAATRRQSDSRIRSDSVHSVGFEDNCNVRTIVADMALPPPPQLSNMSSRLSDGTRAASSNVSKHKNNEITQVE